MGVHFVGFVGQYGYDRVLSVLGRHVRDFLNGLDNLHEYLKFSYPRMRAPSFICENETRQGKKLPNESHVPRNYAIRRFTRSSQKVKRSIASLIISFAMSLVQLERRTFNSIKMNHSFPQVYKK